MSHESRTRIAARKAESVRRQNEDHTSSNLPEPGHLMHVNGAGLSDELLGALIISPSLAKQ